MRLPSVAGWARFNWLDPREAPIATAPDLYLPTRPGTSARRWRPEGQISGDPTYSRGDLVPGFRGAEVVVERVYTTSAALHNCLEAHGCTVCWESDRAVVCTGRLDRVRTIEARWTDRRHQRLQY